MIGMIAIIILTTLIVIFLLLMLVFIFKCIISAINKDKQKVIKNLTLSFVMFMLVIVVSIVDLLVFIPTVYKNRKEIVDFTVNTLDEGIKGTSKILSKTLIYTADELWNNWDNEFVAQLQNIELKVIDYEVKRESGLKTYNIEVVMNNRNETNSKISFEKMIRYNYLAAGDENEILYAFDNDRNSYLNTYVTPGKSLANLKVIVEEDTDIIYLNFVKEKIRLRKAE